MEELNAVREDQSLSEKEREGKTQGILSELGVLASQLTSSNSDLNRMENELKMSSDAKKVASYLSAPKG